MKFRKAVTGDVKNIHLLLKQYADKGLLLHKSLSELYEHIRDYFVIEDDSNNIQGTCGLGICWEDLAEIKSLAISHEYHHQGLGGKFIELCTNEARHFGIKKIFALTYVPDFFKTYGFKEVDKSILPHKIWADCIKCHKFPNCDEIALILDI